MSVKTVCEDLFSVIYKQSLLKENTTQNLQKAVENLENIVHNLRLFTYLTLIAEELGISLPESGNFEENFKILLEEILKAFFNRYSDNFPNLTQEEFVKTFTQNAEISISNLDPYVEDLILLLLGFLIDKNLSEVFTTTKIKNLIREKR